MTSHLKSKMTYPWHEAWRTLSTMLLVLCVRLINAAKVRQQYCRVVLMPVMRCNRVVGPA